MISIRENLALSGSEVLRSRTSYISWEILRPRTSHIATIRPHVYYEGDNNYSNEEDPEAILVQTHELPRSDTLINIQVVLFIALPQGRAITREG
jgi:hypothetical protein